MAATMDYGALQAWCETLTQRLEAAEQRADRYEQAWMLEQARCQVWQLKEQQRQLHAELDATRQARQAEQQVAPDPPDALTGILSAQVARQGGRCLICEEAPALYCSLDCARRGR